jgi:hypothetical protein
MLQKTFIVAAVGAVATPAVRPFCGAILVTQCVCQVEARTQVAIPHRQHSLQQAMCNSDCLLKTMC